MGRRFPALLAVLVAVTVLAVSVPAVSLATTGPDGVAQAPENESSAVPPARASAPVIEVQNTTSYLALPNDEVATSGYGRAGLDVAGAVAADTGQLSARYLETSAFVAFEESQSATERTAALRRATATVANRSEALQQRQRAAIRAYNSGSITTATFVRRLAVIDARAARLERVIDRIRRDAIQTRGYSPPNALRIRLDNLRAELQVLQGPVRSLAEQSIAGQRRADALYVETATDSVVLATTDGDRYVREGYLDSAYIPGNVDQFAQSDQYRISQAYDRAGAIYPWAFENVITQPSADGFGNSSIYLVNIDHAHGQLTSYIDGATTDVFHESQEKRLSVLPVATNVTNSTDTLSIQVHVTHDSGPTKVHVYRSGGTGADAQVSVNDQVVGRTGSDGQLWTIDPNGGATVVATTSTGERISVEIPPDASIG